MDFAAMSSEERVAKAREMLELGEGEKVFTTAQAAVIRVSINRAIKQERRERDAAIAELTRKHEELRKDFVALHKWACGMTKTTNGNKEAYDKFCVDQTGINKLAIDASKQLETTLKLLEDTINDVRTLTAEFRNLKDDVASPIFEKGKQVEHYENAVDLIAMHQRMNADMAVD